MATVEAHTRLVVLALARNTFVEVLGPLEELMAREKSPQVRRAWLQVEKQCVWRLEKAPLPLKQAAVQHCAESSMGQIQQANT